MKKAGKTPLDRLIYAGCLAAVFGLFYVTVRLAPNAPNDIGLVGALGFLLIAGTLLSELVEAIGVPHLTGYLLAGILAGPHVLRLIDLETVHRLRPVNTLAIALIALAGGAELRLETLKSGLKSLAVATLFHTVLGIAGMAAIFFVARPRFVGEMPASGVLGVGILWGVVAITRSPSALLGILSQTRANGPLARFGLQFIMTSDVVVVIAFSAALDRSSSRRSEHDDLLGRVPRSRSRDPWECCARDDGRFDPRPVPTSDSSLS